MLRLAGAALLCISLPRQCASAVAQEEEPRLPAAAAAVNITWAEFSDAKCTIPLGKPAGGMNIVGKCGVVPQGDPNPQWRGSSFRFDRCTAPPAGRPAAAAVAFYSAFVDHGCATPFVNWTLSTAAMDCVLVPPGPNTNKPRGKPIWHSVVAISCVIGAIEPTEPPPPPAKETKQERVQNMTVFGPLHKCNPGDSKSYAPPLGRCYSPPALWENDTQWGSADTFDTCNATHISRSFYATTDGSCGGKATDGFDLPLHTCLGPFGLPRPWGEFACPLVVTDTSSSATPIRKQSIDVSSSEWFANASALPPPPAGHDAAAEVEYGAALFTHGKVTASVTAFDTAVTWDGRVRGALWQRGCAMYYTEQWVDGAAQFAFDVSANPNDTEESVWRWLCQARSQGVTFATANILNTTDEIRPYMQKVYAMYKAAAGAGAAAAEKEVLALCAGSGAQESQGCFYSNMYYGLYAEAHGNATAAQGHLYRAAVSAYVTFSDISGSISTIWTVLSWICAGMYMCGALSSPVCA